MKFNCPHCGEELEFKIVVDERGIEPSDFPKEKIIEDVEPTNP